MKSFIICALFILCVGYFYEVYGQSTAVSNTVITMWDENVLDNLVFKKDHGVLYWAWKDSCKEIKVTKYFNLLGKEIDCNHSCAYSYTIDQPVRVCEWSNEIPGPVMKRLMSD